MQTIIEDLNWRYATKKYDPTKKISNEDLNTLLEVLRLAPSSFGLQPLKFLLIENKEIRVKLKEKSQGQSQITDASHLIVFCANLAINDQHVDQHMENTATKRGIPTENLDLFSEHIKKSIQKMDDDKHLNWTSKQAYIALGLLLYACAQMRIDSTPMEGFDSDGYDEILDLKSKNLHATLVFPIGYRAEDDKYHKLSKVRKDHSDLFEFIM